MDQEEIDMVAEVIRSGWIYGESSCQCSMQKERWIEKRPLLTVASLRQKKGRLRRENQKGQRH